MSTVYIINIISLHIKIYFNFVWKTWVNPKGDLAKNKEFPSNNGGNY